MSSILEFFSYNKSVLSGAMDIIVVKQPDDSYKISPFRIRFGSFRVFKAKEKIVNILVNGQKCELTMRLSECGEAYFMTELKRVTDNNILLDGYSSPVDLGNSAPNSPKKKYPIELPKLSTMPDLNLEEKDNTVTEVTELTVQGVDDQNNQVNITVKETNNEEVEVETNMKMITDPDEQVDPSNFNFSHSEFVIETAEVEKRQRKMSFDVFSRDEKYYKFRPCRENYFTIESANKKPLSGLKIELSNSWNSMAKSKDNLEDIFTKNKITKEEFFKDPWKVINSQNLAIRYEDYVYTWKVIAPIILAQLAFNQELPADVLSSLTQQQQGFLMWKKVNMDAFKIDIKKKIEVLSELNNTMTNTTTTSIPNPKSPEKSTSISNSPSSVKNFQPPSTDSLKQIEQSRRQSIQYKKSYTLTSEQIKSLNLNKGKNEISFVVSSRYQGTHILTSDIYLWDYDDKIIISDLDGTITRSDVLGQFFPFIGRDWSHKGVVKLYNDIDKNGYKILYLTARAICQSDQTKDYLKNKLIQNNLKLPPGPLLMSPDGLVSSFKREVIDRIPQSFKIQCLTQVLNLFPPESYPFYCGLGNRHTDAVAYEAVGISKSKIFIINEKSEITQYNNFYRTSYSTINEMVHEMFPPVKSNNTYFSSMNYFRPTYGNLSLKDAFD